MPSSDVDGDGPDDRAWSYDTHGRLERVKRHIQNSDELTDADREALEEFEAAMRSYNSKEFRFSDATIGGHLEMCFRLAKETKQLAAMIYGDDVQAAVDDVVGVIDEMDVSDDFKGSFLSALRVYGDMMTDGGMPDRFDELAPSTYINDDPTPITTNVLEWQDVIEMVEATDHIRDKALILTAWGAGLRAEAELWKLQFKQIDDRGDHLVISVTDDTKNDYHGAREIHLYAGSAMLRKWLYHAHPAHSEDGLEPETRVWTYHKSDKPIHYQALWKAFKVTGEKAGIEKDYNPTHMRRSRASCLARQATIDEYDLRNYFGWGIKGNSAAHYIAKFSDETAKHVAMADGHSVQNFEDPDPIAPLECPNCDRWTTRNLQDCIWCATEIPEDRHAVRHTVKGPEKGEKSVLDMLMSGEISAEDLETLQRLEPAVRSRPEIFDDLDQLITLAKGYEKEQEDTPTTAVTGPIGIGAVVSATASKWAVAKDRLMRAHPMFEYPLKKETAAKLGVTWTLILVAAVALLSQNGAIAALQAGDPTEWIGLLVALSVGVGVLMWDLPDPEETAGALLEEMQYSNR